MLPEFMLTLGGLMVGGLMMTAVRYLRRTL
jgi:hypothetical protein